MEIMDGWDLLHGHGHGLMAPCPTPRWDGMDTVWEVDGRKGDLFPMVVSLLPLL